MGLRELKKRKTRKAISDIATHLFVEHGYHSVTTATIAEKAEVSVPTLFNYFPTKESLVFDEDSEMEAELVASVTNRKKGQKILDALLEAGLRHIETLPEANKKTLEAFMGLIDRTPELSVYAKQMWMRHERSLAAAIRKESKGLSTLEAEVIARFVLDAYHRAVGASKPKAALRSMFDLLKKGWSD